MIILGYRVPMLASLLVWAALWEIVGQLQRQLPAAAAVERLRRHGRDRPDADLPLGPVGHRLRLRHRQCPVDRGRRAARHPDGAVGDRRSHLPAVGQPLPLGAAHRAGAGHHGAVRPRPDDHHPHRRPLRHLDHRARHQGRRARHRPVAGRDGRQLRRQPLAGLPAHLFLGGAAGDPRRRQARA